MSAKEKEQCDEFIRFVMSCNESWKYYDRELYLQTYTTREKFEEAVRQHMTFLTNEQYEYLLGMSYNFRMAKNL